MVLTCDWAKSVPAKCGRRCQRFFFIWRTTCHDLKRGIDTHRLLIVEIFITQCDGNDALSQHGSLVVDDIARITRIRNALVDRVDQSDLPIHLPQQECPRIGGQPSSQKICHDLATFQRCEVDPLRVTLCHSREPWFSGDDVLVNTVILDPRLASYTAPAIGL